MGAATETNLSTQRHREATMNPLETMFVSAVVVLPMLFIGLRLAGRFATRAAVKRRPTGERIERMRQQVREDLRG